MLPVVTRLYAYSLHQRVQAVALVTEDDAEPDPAVGPCEPGWTHCVPGDVGTVVYIDLEQEGMPTVVWDRTGTTTLCGLEEIVPLAEA